LPEFVQRLRRVFQSSETVFGYDLACLAGSADGFCRRCAHAGVEARRRLKGALGQSLLGQHLGCHAAEDVGLFGDAGEDLGQGLRGGGAGQAQHREKTARADHDTHIFIL
jgi:hypothetical protein